MKSYKYFIIIIMLALIGYQLYIIVTEFSSTRVIEVRKEIYETNEKDYLKGYNITNIPFEQFDILVTPKSFLDYISLTNEKGNLLSIILTIVASCWIVFYIFKQDVENLALSKNLDWVKWAMLLIAVAFIAYSYGLDHTRDFWRSIYTYKAKTDFWKYDFYVETKSNAMVYAYLSMIVGGLLGTISGYYKPATIIFKEED